MNLKIKSSPKNQSLQTPTNIPTKSMKRNTMINKATSLPYPSNLK